MTALDVPDPVRRSAAELADLQRDLRARVDGEVRFDAGSRAAYSTDSSNYRQPPIAVVVPRSVDAVVSVVVVCREHGAPLLSRGGGTSLAGQTTNAAVVVDWTKHCNRLLSVDEAARTCVVEPGIALDDLNEQLAGRGLMFGPRPSTHPSCTVGGMIGNNSCGATAQAYGKTVDNVRRLEVLTYDGLRMWVGPTGQDEYDGIVAQPGRRADIYRQLTELRDAHLGDIRTRYPDIPRRVSGYNLDSLLPERGFDVARALVGSEGTLVTVLHAELDLVPLAMNKALVVLGYPDIAAAGDAVPQVLRHEPWQLEGIDDVLIGLEKADHDEQETIAGLPSGGGWLLVQFIGDTMEESEARARGLVDDVHGSEAPPHVKLLTDEAKEDCLGAVREAGLGATAHPSAKHDTWEGWEDSAVPPERLGDYLRDLRTLFDEFGYSETTSLYGHFGQGCVHARIPFELRTADGIARYRRFVERAARLVVSYGGSLSGEHGDGQSRGELLATMYGKEVVRAFERLKRIFDPANSMNPGKIVSPFALDSNLKLGIDYQPWEPRTHFAFPKDENRFSRAASRCVGVGNCRSSGGDGQVMCPSYQVTREETHSTRGRARLLFEMIRGEVITDGWRSTEVRDALDLCLSCKGCRSDCPVEVDMATYKAEFLSHHYAGR
ncbi:MAG: FAD-binding oxidoreductase, partial [Sporichthyaceae bacterium]|nr:FAD-binding oxidoreductase [Sporichthyaceae bacterium]